MQHHAADELDVERTKTEHAAGGLADGREGRHQKIVERHAVGDLAAELLGPGAQLLVRESLHLGLERVDLRDLRPVAFQAAVIG